ncbi:MAG: hypothetical protein IJ660_07560 [Alphaproteobacteria bacterium]|nr:hypothetical protein [Alphaproteobacteria bacterium]
MRYLVRLCLVCLFLVGCSGKDSEAIQFYTHEGCPYCEKALKYIQINYPKLPLQVYEIGQPANMVKFVECADKFKLDRKQLGTPLICMGENYIMGWSQENQKLFNEYVKSYLPKK